MLLKNMEEKKNTEKTHKCAKDICEGISINDYEKIYLDLLNNQLSK